MADPRYRVEVRIYPVDGSPASGDPAEMQPGSDEYVARLGEFSGSQLMAAARRGATEAIKALDELSQQHRMAYVEAWAANSLPAARPHRHPR